MKDFWSELTQGMHREASPLDEHLGSRIPSESVRKLTDKVREARALGLPVDAGTRVRFANNLGAVMSYTDPPDGNSEGTVVTVRTASGDVTAQDSLVFVKWDSGSFLPVHREHLRLATTRVATLFKMRVSSVGDLSDFIKTSSDDLIHKSTKELWSLQKDGDEYVISRLFDDVGSPLKV